MKKTNILLILILIINAVILWKVWCCASHCTEYGKCNANTECTAGAGCSDDAEHNCCTADGKCTRDAEHGCCAHKSCHKGEQKCSHGHEGCKHGDKKCSHEHKCDSTCQAGHCMTSMMLHMPEDHKAETQAWMKDSLGLSDEQIATITEGVAGISEKMEATHADLKAAVDANNETIKGMLNDEQMKMVEAMMMEHCKASHASCCKKSCDHSKCKHEDGDKHEHTH